MPKKYPVLTLAEVIEIMNFNNFTLNNTVGSHRQYVATIGNVSRRVTVDTSIDDFDDYLLKSMMRQSGLSREEFYCSSKSAAKKISMRIRNK